MAANGVTREGGTSPAHTSAIISGRHFDPGVAVVYIVNGSSAGLKHAMGAGPAAALLGGPILLVSQDGISRNARNELDRLDPGKILVVGGARYVSNRLLNRLQSFTAGPVRREAGSTPAHTSAVISRRHFSPGVNVVYIVNGSTGLKHALAAGPAAARHGGPILLVSQDSISNGVRNELDRLNPGKIIVVGSAGHVSNRILNRLGNFTTGSVRRETGTTPSHISAVISRRHFAPGVNVAYIANGSATGVKHAWAAGPSAAKQGGPLLLVSQDSIPDTVREELDRLNPHRIIVVGRTGIVSNAVMTHLESYIPRPPVAVDDNFGTLVSGCGWQERVLANDTDGDDSGAELTVTAVSDPAHGTATILPTREGGTLAPRVVRYTSDPGYTGSDSFTYIVTDPDGASDEGLISVNVTASTSDADSDGVADECDPFAADSSNSSGASLPFNLGFGGGDGGILDTGFVGLMTNSRTASLDLLDGDVQLNGSGALVDPTVDEGDAFRGENLQRNALQANLEMPSGNFTVHGVVCDPYPTEAYGSVGIFFGPGDQDNYIKAVVSWNSNQAATQVHDVREHNGSAASIARRTDAAIADAPCVDLYLSVNKQAGTYSPSYSLDGGTTRIGFGGQSSRRTVPASWLADSDQLAVGVIATSQGPSPEFVATWDRLQVTAD